MNPLDLSILKVLFTNKKHALDFAAESNEKLFEPDNVRLAKIVVDYLKNYRDVPTRRVILERIRQLKNDAFLRHAELSIDEIETHQYDDREYRHDLEKIKTRFAEKVIGQLRESLNGSGKIDIRRTLTELQGTIQTIRSVNEVKAYTHKDLKEAVPDFKERYMAKKKNPDVSTGLMTGFTWLDYITGGISPGTLTLVAAASGAGKSTVLMNVALSMWANGNSIHSRKDFREGNDVVFYSLEMPFELCQERVISRLAMVPQKSIKNATLSEEEGKSVAATLRFMETYPWNFDIVDMPRGSTLEAMETIYSDIASRKRKPKVIVVDYLSLMSAGEDADPNQGDWLQLGKAAEKLHEFSRVYNAVVLSAVQLNEPKPGAKATEDNYGLGAVGRSRMINHNADLILSLEKREKEAERPDVRIHIIKSRSTEHGSGTMYKNFACCAILNDPAYDGSAASTDGDISAKVSEYSTT